MVPNNIWYQTMFGTNNVWYQTIFSTELRLLRHSVHCDQLRKQHCTSSSILIQHLDKVSYLFLCLFIVLLISDLFTTFNKMFAELLVCFPYWIMWKTTWISGKLGQHLQTEKQHPHQYWDHRSGRSSTSTMAPTPYRY